MYFCRWMANLKKEMRWNGKVIKQHFPILIVINKPQIIHILHRFELSFIFVLYLCDRNNSIFANKKDDVVENSFAFSSPMDIWCRE